MTFEKVLKVFSCLSVTEVKTVASAPTDIASEMTQIDKSAFNQGVEAYLKTEAERLSIESDAQQATITCRLVESMLNN